MANAKAQEYLQKEVEIFQKLQKDLQKLLTGRQQLDTQLNENTIVKEELDLLQDDSTVYKMIGPVLVKQDLEESRLNVQKRIDYIQGELKRHDKSIKEIQVNQERKKETLQKLQSEYQKQMQKQTAKV